MPNDIASGLANELTPAPTGAMSDMGKFILNLIGAARNMGKAQPPPLNQKLPRIVPDGKGGFMDLNTNAPVSGRSTPAPKQTSAVDPYLRNYQADQELNKAGSVMGSDKGNQIANRASQGPLLNAVSQVANMANPIDWMGGFGNSMANIPTGVWKNMQPEAKALLNVLGDKFPQFFEKVLGSKTPLMASVLDAAKMPEAYGTMATYRPSLALANKLGTPEAANTPINALMNVRADQTGNLGTGVHELQHYLNYPRVAGTNGPDAATIGMLLGELLPQGGRNQGSLMRRANEYNAVAPMGVEGPMASMANADFFKPRMAEKFNNVVGQTPLHGGEGYYKVGESLPDFTGRAMMDEGLAYLGEHGQTANPQQSLLDLAKSLGVGTTY